ncbi:hypothetical protein OSB04_020843 [Centaurea solstitialis]|uniref:Uncharacterized protein n=1 Tax=Centaurea solstitialis TaxID=347529 RepID=A0AA38WDN2_9ASTR|nr:hypothetical protein OSB04_020843 [Centaurea solstitialis]
MRPFGCVDSAQEQNRAGDLDWAQSGQYRVTGADKAEPSIVKAVTGKDRALRGKEKREFYEPLHLMNNGNWLVGSRGKVYAHEVDLTMKTTKEVWRHTPTPTNDPMKIIWK